VMTGCKEKKLGYTDCIWDVKVMLDCKEKWLDYRVCLWEMLGYSMVK